MSRWITSSLLKKQVDMTTELVLEIFENTDEFPEDWRRENVSSYLQKEEAPGKF